MKTNREFVRVEPKKRDFKVKAQEIRFPNEAILTLSEVNEDNNSKMLTLSPAAFEVLGVTAEENRVSLVRGYKDEEQKEQAFFLTKTSAESDLVVDEDGTSNKMPTAKFNYNTRRAKSARYHGVLTDTHSKSMDSNEKYYMLSTAYGQYWLLEEYFPKQFNSRNIVNPTKDESDNPQSVGESVKVIVENN